MMGTHSKIRGTRKEPFGHGDSIEKHKQRRKKVFINLRSQKGDLG